MFSYTNAPEKRINLGIDPSASTLQHMKTAIIEGSKNQYVRKFAEHLVENVSDRDEWGEIDAIFTFLQHHTRFAKDPRGLEYIRTPYEVLTRIERGDIPSLDCDDYTVTGLALARTLGYPTMIKATSYTPNKTLSHVYGKVQIHGEWVNFDAVRKDRSLGWEASNITNHLGVMI